MTQPFRLDKRFTPEEANFVNAMSEAVFRGMCRFAVLWLGLSMIIGVVAGIVAFAVNKQ